MGSLLMPTQSMLVSLKALSLTNAVSAFHKWSPKTHHQLSCRYLCRWHNSIQVYINWCWWCESCFWSLFGPWANSPLGQRLVCTNHSMLQKPNLSPFITRKMTPLSILYTWTVLFLRRPHVLKDFLALSLLLTSNGTLTFYLLQWKRVRW